MTLSAVLDHAIINVRDRLDRAQDTFGRLGFTLTPRGHHTLGSSNHLCMFDENYLELLGYESAAQRPELARQPLGLGGLVFKMRDAEESFQHLRRSGVEAEAPRAFQRPVALGETRGATMHEARFQTVHLAPGQVPYGRVFFCQHETPELVWQPQWQSHANGVTHIAAFILAADDVQEATQLYQAMFGADAFTECADGSRMLAAGKAWVHCLPAPRTLALFQQQERFPSLPCMAGLVFHTTSLELVRQACASGGIAVREENDALLVDGADALGVPLMFIARSYA